MKILALVLTGLGNLLTLYFAFKVGGVAGTKGALFGLGIICTGITCAILSLEKKNLL